jgi:pimeloyl-ACP methyl ester carboxylesterase
MLDPFDYCIVNRQRNTPTEDEVFEFTVHAQDGVRIEGWGWRNPMAARGTLFMLHGFCGHCGLPEACAAGFRLAREFGLSLVAHDSRHHGRSGDRFPTFGTAEMWDFQAVLTEAEHRGFPKPFIALGDSLGAMAAQRTAIVDERIRGAFLQHPPGWPLDALGVCLGRATPLAAAGIMASYRRDILTDGDLRRHPAHPAHEPFILYIVGDQDHYGWQKTRGIYGYWYWGEPPLEGFAPCQEKAARKWFVLVPGAAHPGPDTSYHVWHWSGYTDVLHAFVARCLEG